MDLAHLDPDALAARLGTLAGSPNSLEAAA